MNCQLISWVKIQPIWETLSDIINDIIKINQKYDQHTIIGDTYQKIDQISEIVDQILIVTQNIDGLALRLSQKPNINIIELHGNYSTMKCTKCKTIKETLLDQKELICLCSGYFRPNIVLLNENIQQKYFTQINSYIKNKRPEYVVILGTVMQLDYLHYFKNIAKQRGSKIIHINPFPKYAINVKKNETFLNHNGNDGLEIVKNIISESCMY